MHFILALLPLAALLTSPARAAPPCDPGLRGVSDPALAYRQRDAQRCEGFYISPVSRTGSLRLVGLRRGGLNFSEQDKHLTLQLPDSGGALLRVRALALPEKTYYRLDAAPSAGVWQWPLEVVQRGKLTAQDLGVYAYLAQTEAVYLPVMSDPAAPLTVTLQSSQALARLTWRYAGTKDGRCRPMPAWTEMAGAEEGQRIELSLPADAPGELCLEAAGQPKTGGGWLQAQWRVRSGP